MTAKHNVRHTIVVAIIVGMFVAAAGTSAVQAAGLSFGYGGQGVWPNPATANSQRWFRCRVTYDGTINDDGVPNERIDGLYLYGVSYNGNPNDPSDPMFPAAPSGATYYTELTSSKGIYDAGTRGGGGSGGVIGSIRLTVVASPTKVYYQPPLGQSYYTGQLSGFRLDITSGLGNGNQYDILTNGSDFSGYYLTLDAGTPLDTNVCPDLEQVGLPSTTRIYYEPIVISQYYPDHTLGGMVLRFTAGEATGQEFDIVDNATIGGYHYIDVSEDTEFPTELNQEGTVDSIDSSTKFYYTDIDVGEGALVGETIQITSGTAAGEERVVDWNGEDGTGTYIQTTTALPAGLAATDTFTIKDVMHVCDTADLVDLIGMNDTRTHFGVARYTDASYPSYNYVYTVGPFSNYHDDYLVGRIPTGSTEFWFRLYWSSWNSADGVYEAQDPIEIKGTQITTDIALHSYIGDRLWESGEIQAWYSGKGTGVDPLVTTRSAPGGPTDPDNGAGSDEYTFRIKYLSGLAGYPEIRSQWWRHTDPTTEFGEEYNFVNFNTFAYKIMRGYGTPADAWVHDLKYIEDDKSLPGEYAWMYGPDDDHHQDRIGDAGIAELDPEAILIVDGDYNRPYYMTKESGETLTNGLVYKYTIRPTNYLQLLHNIFTLQFDQPYTDTWDVAYSGLHGEPTCNTYTSMHAGGHTYEFLTCRDWDPPVWGVGGTDTPGGFAHAGPCSLTLRGMPGHALEAAHLVNEGWYRGSGYHPVNDAHYYGPDVYLETVELWHNDDDPAGYGYPYDSQDTTKYPKVDPVLTAHPYFEDGPLSSTEQGFPAPGWYLGDLGPGAPGADANPFNPLPSTLPPTVGTTQEPWGDLNGPYDTSVWGGYGGTQHSPLRFTNEDTIWPNYVNIRPETDPDYPFRGGKWTTDTTFVFRINYWQSDNLQPQVIQIFIRKVDEEGNPLGDWQGRSMSKVYATDNDYTDGCLYYYEATVDQLPSGGGPGDYQYYFQASDGSRIAIYPNRPSDDPGYIGVPPGDNDFYWFRVNTKPQLANQSVAPASGTQGDPFVYKVTYYDDDGEVYDANHQGDRPFKSILHIDLFGDAEGQAKVAGVAGNVITYEFDPPGGEPYEAGSLDQTHVVGSLPYMTVRMQTGDAAGQQFDIIGNAVISSTQGTITVAPGTDLSEVTTGDLFNIADWFATTMEPEDPSDTNYRDGAVYELNTARAGVILDEGTHHYYFEFWDNWAYWIDWQQYFMDSSVADPIDQKVEGEMVRFPQAGYFEGPEVMLNSAPTLSAYFFAPPDVDEVASEPVGDTFEYVRPGDLPGYADDALAGMYIQMRTGLAQFQTFEIDSNTTTTITATTNIAAAGVTAGNRFRVFAHRNGDGFLSWDYDTDDTYEGTPATPFHFYVTYTDAENVPPSVIRVQIDGDPGQSYNMTKVLPEDTTYADGCEYMTITSLKLDEGIHTFKAQAYDGALWYDDSDGTAGSSSQFYGPKDHEAEAAQGPDIAPNTEPSLGFQVGTGVVSDVISPITFTYTDGDSLTGDPVVAVDFGAKGKFRVASIDHNTQTIVLRSDADLEGAGIDAGDVFTATVELDPTVGLEDTEYTYWIVYTDTDSYAGVHGNPPSFVKVFIDNQEHLMTAWDARDTDMTDGRVYYYSTAALSASQSHSYYFIASDGLDNVRLPAAPGFFSGPSVNMNNPPLPPPYPPADGWYPIGGISVETQTPTLDWPAGSDPDDWDNVQDLTYVVQLSSAADFGTVDYEYDTNDYGGAGVTELDVPDALAYGWWYWRVQTVGTRGLTSAWSEIHNFKVDHAPGPPTSGFSPTGQIGTQAPMLEWDPGTDVDPDDPPEQMYYYVELDDDADFSSPIISPDLGSPGNSEYGVTGQNITQFQVDASLGLANDTMHYWRVRTVNALTSEWSATQTFTVVIATYSISGTVTDENTNPVPGVTITAYDSRDIIVAEAVTADDGTYELTGLPADDYRVVPSYDPFTFSLTEEAVTLTDSSVTDVDFQLVPGAWSISGTITLGAGGPGVEDVLVSIGARWATTDANGDYTITGVPNGDYTVTPTLEGHIFEPLWRDVTVAGAPVPGVNFIEPPPTYSVSGAIVDQDSAPLADVTVAAYDATDTKVAEDTTDADGLYELSGLVAGTYRVEPTKDEYDFDPADIDIELVDLSLTGQDFVGTLRTYTISGRITKGTEGLEGVQVSDGTRVGVSDTNGDYTITGVPNGAYTVTPTLSYHDFDPTSQAVTVADADVSDVDFEGIPQTFTVSGTVTDYNGDPLSGVQITDGTNNTTTITSGQYSLSGVEAGTATISASKSGYVFDPDSQQITVPDTITGVDFVGYEEFSKQLATGIHLIGVPCQPLSDDAEQVFGTDQVARWNPLLVPPDYMRVGDPGSQELLRVTAGRGFFVNFGTATNLIVGGTPVATDTAFTVGLGPIWNMIANPFAAALPLANVQPTTPGTVLPFAFVYDNASGSYLLVSAQPGINVARTNLGVWEGAWMRTTGGNAFLTMGPLTGPTAADEAATKPQALQLGESGWIIPVVARTAGRSDLMSAAGVAPTVGTYTIPNPPRVAGTVDVYFTDEHGNQLAQHVKPAMAEQVSWDMVVVTDIAESDVDVMLPDLSQVPHNLSVTLTDLDIGRSIYARTCPKYTFRSGEQGAERHLRLQVAPQGTDNLVINTASAQSGGQGVVLTYAVTKSCEVAIRVMNISGRVIKTLASGQTVDKGVNTQTWNLRNASGTLVPNGLYLLEIEARTANGQQVSALCHVNIAR